MNKFIFLFPLFFLACGGTASSADTQDSGTDDGGADIADLIAQAHCALLVKCQKTTGVTDLDACIANEKPQLEGRDFTCTEDNFQNCLSSEIQELPCDATEPTTPGGLCARCLSPK